MFNDMLRVPLAAARRVRDADNIPHVWSPIIASPLLPFPPPLLVILSSLSDTSLIHSGSGYGELVGGGGGGGGTGEGDRGEGASTSHQGICSETALASL